MLYDELFTLRNMGDMPEDKTYKDYLNPDSVKMLPDAKAEKGIFDSEESRFQVRALRLFYKGYEKSPHLQPDGVPEGQLPPRIKPV